MNYLYANKKLLSRYGKSLSEVTGQNYANFHLPEATKLFSDRVKKVLKSDKPFTYEYKSQRDKKDFLRTLNPFINRSTGEITAITVISKDISEQKQMARALEKSEEKLRNFIDSSTIGIWCFRLESPVDIALPKEKMIKAFFKTVCVECNDTYAEMMGTTKDEILGTVLYEVMPDTEENRDYLEAFINNNFRISGGISHEIGKNGLEKYFSNSMVGTIKNGKLIEAWGTQTDITELKHTEKKIRLLSQITENSPVAMVVLDMNKKITYVNPFFLNLYGYDSEEILNKPVAILSGEDEPEHYSNIFNIVSGKGLWRGQDRRKRKDGTIFWASSSITEIKDEKGNIFCYSEVSRDITERKRMEEALCERERFFSGTLNDMLTFVAVLKPDGSLIFVNDTALKVAGIKLEDVIGKRFYDAYWFRYSEKVKQTIREDINACSAGKTLTRQIKIQTANGVLIWIEFRIHPIYDKDGKVKYMVPEGRDITDRKQAEEALNKVNRTLRMLSDCNQALIRARNEPDILNNVCRTIVETGGYHLAWIGFNEQDEKKTVRPVAQAGFEDGYLKTLNITWADTEQGRGPTGRAIRTGKPYMIKNIHTDPDFAPWRNEATKRGYVSTISLPLIDNGRILGALNIYATEPDAFNTEEIELLTELADDLIYGVMALRTSAERKRAEKALREAEERFRTIFENITIGMYRTTPDGLILMANPALIRMLGYSSFDELAMLNLEEAGYNPELPRSIFKQRIESEGEVVGLESAWTRRDGTTLFVRESGKAIRDDAGNTLYYEGTAEDITEHKRAEKALQESEEKYRTIIEHTGTGLAIIEEDTTIHFVNKEYEKITGYTKEEVEDKVSWTEHIVKEDVELMKKRNKERRITGGKVPSTYEFRLIAKNGEIKNILLNVNMIPGTSRSLTSLIDITGRKRAEKKARKSEERYRTLFKETPIGILTCDTKGIIQNVNMTALKILGSPSEDATKQINLLTFHLLKEAGISDDIRRCIEKGCIVISEKPYTTKWGKPLIVQSKMTPITDEKGKINGVLYAFDDISERKRAENQIRLLTTQIEKFSRISADILSIEDDRELFIKISSAIVEISDFSRVMFYTFKKDFPYRDILGYHGLDKKTIERLKKVGVSREELGTIFKKGIPLGNQSCYIPHAMKDILDQKAVNNGKKEYAPGKGRWHREDNLFIALKDEAGDFIGMISVDDSKSGDIPTDETVKPLEMFANHISQILQSRKLEKKIRDSEEQYRLLVENVNDAIVISQYDKFIFINKQFATMLGYKYDELLMKDYTEVYTEKAVEILMERQRIRNRGTEASSRYETVFKKKDGKTIDVEVNVAIIEYRGDRATFAVIRDVTERKRIEKEARRNQNLESIGVLAGGIAHDFNNILTIILGNITLSKMYAKPEDKVYKRLVEAEKGAMRAKDLTQQLLTFSKGGAPVKETSSVAEFLKESAAFALSGSNVKCIFSIPDDIWAVEIDKGQINQVFNNLVINADQAMPEGGILKVNAENITITSENILSLQKGKYVKFSFEDHGIGISSHYLDKIFDPYFSTKTKGSGLGLASAYSIIRNHNGLITVESELGVGTTFYIYLPASEEIIVEKKAEAGKALFGKGKILIMDDEDFIREVAGEMVESLGYSAEFASDGAEAIELYGKALKSEEPFAAVIMDLTIPGGMGGKEAVRELLKIDPEVKAIVSSGYSSDPIMSDCKKYGFVGVVAKPYKISELGKTLKEIILK